MKSSSVEFDGGRVIELVDALGVFPASIEDVFSGATDHDWAGSEAIDPSSKVGSMWHLAFRSFLIRGPHIPTVLIDTGIGPLGSLAEKWAPVPGSLPEELLALDVQPSDIDMVVLSHLHEDHVGWAVVQGRPTFENATYHIQSAELDTLPPASQFKGVVDPLMASGQLVRVDGDTELVRCTRDGVSINLVSTPGHSLGHQSIHLLAGHREILLTGDVFVHAVQLINPAVEYAFESDSAQAVSTRHAMLGRLVERGAILATSHFLNPYWTPAPDSPFAGPQAETSG